MAFDPCREWLGIDAIDLADPWRVLGLDTGAGDAEEITRAAAARLDVLAHVKPGPFGKAHATLIAKVEEARDALLAQAFLAEARSRPVPPPPPLIESAAVEAEAAGVPAPLPSIPPSPSDPAPADLIVTRPAAGRPGQPAPPRSTGAGGLLLGSLALLAAAVILLLALLLEPEGGQRQVAFFNRSTAPLAPASSPGGPRPRPAATTINRPRVSQETPVPPPAESAASTSLPLAPPPEIERAPRQPMAETPAPPGIPETTDESAAEAARRRQEAEAAEAARRAERQRIRLREILDKALGDAYAAMQRGEFDTADRVLTAAGNQIGDDVDAATRLERWRLFLAYAREFTDYRDQAFEAAKTGDYTVGGKTFALVEITPELVIYRLAGRNERVSRERLDPRIELAIVEKWFAADGRPANHLFLGARWLCLDPPNVSRARAEWRTAADGGEETTGLVALTDDPIIRRTAPGATP